MLPWLSKQGAAHPGTEVAKQACRRPRTPSLPCSNVPVADHRKLSGEGHFTDEGISQAGVL